MKIPVRSVTVALAAGVCAGALATAPADAADLNSITSFDGVKITFYWFPAVGLAPGETAPTVLQGPGFGGQAEDDPDAKSGTSIPGVGPLRQAGYNVLTWNPRGISPSGGVAMLDNPNYEGRDVSELIDWVATQPEAKLDASGDPRVGMTGGSYGGGIQFSTAGIDHRLDAIVPVIAWNSLATSLYKEDTIKTAWINALMAGATKPGNHFSPNILAGRKQAKKGDTFSPRVVNFAKSAGPYQVLPQITTPTLIIQGTVDNLFPLTESIANYKALKATGVPLKMIWFCGGHGLCQTKGGDSTFPVDQTWTWLDKYLKGNSSADTGPAFSWIDQNGVYRTASDYPVSTGTLKASGKGTLAVKNKGGAGPYNGKLPSGISPVTALVLRPTIPTPAKNAVSVKLRAKKQAVIVGEPKVSLTYKGKAPAKKDRVLAQIVDPASKSVVGHAITPVPVRLNGKKHKITLPLEAISFDLAKGKSLELQLVSQSSAYNVFPKGGSVKFSRIALTLPTMG